MKCFDSLKRRNKNGTNIPNSSLEFCAWRSRKMSPFKNNQSLYNSITISKQSLFGLSTEKKKSGENFVLKIPELNDINSKY